MSSWSRSSGRGTAEPGAGRSGKIHGTVKEGGGEPIIGIDESHIYKDSKEAKAVIDLLTQNHVVILGYAGGDEKILHALRSVSDEDPETPPESLTNLFVINLSGPGIRLPNIQQKRRSETLVLESIEAGFENFMEGLEQALAHPEDASEAAARPDAPPRILYSTQLEAVAAGYCRKLALNIRSTINVAETGRVDIIEHGAELFERCLELARSAGLALTSPEKYLILCAGYLHDLGYFLGYSTDRAGENPGWQLLENHGEFTAELLEKYLTEEWKRLITPVGYSDESRDIFVETLIDVCRNHSLTLPLADPGPPPEARQRVVGELCPDAGPDSRGFGGRQGDRGSPGPAHVGAEQSGSSSRAAVEGQRSVCLARYPTPTRCAAPPEWRTMAERRESLLPQQRR